MGAADGAVLERALGRILPGRDETWLLRAILHRGGSAQEAWAEFRGVERDLPGLFRTDTGNRNRLSPLLATSIRENDLPADPRLLTVLRTATLREELRADAYDRIARSVFRLLDERGLPYLVVKGAALARTVYAEPFHRHAHDIDLLLPPQAAEGAAEALRRAGWTPLPDLPMGQGRQLRHATELPVLLLERAFRIPFYRGDHALLASRSRLAGDGGPPIPGATDALLLTLGHASYCPNRSNLMWAVDAWMILTRGDVDWTALPERTRAMRLEVPVGLMLRWLADELGAPVPGEIRDTLATTGDVDGLRRDVALFGSRQTRGAHPELEGRARPPLRERLTLLRWELLPSRHYLAWAYGDPPAALLPLLYLTRPVSALANRLRWRVVGWLRRG